MITSTLDRPASAEQILASIPDGPYEKLYQPAYDDVFSYQKAIAELLVTEPVTTPEQIDRLRNELAYASNAESGYPVIITAECAERVDLKTPIGVLAGRLVASRALVLSVYPKAVKISRDRGQLFKPRSNQFEVLANSNIVPSYQGDGVNGLDPSDREPQPFRLVAAAVQSRGLEQRVKEMLGIHVPAAHEALHLGYEKSFIANYNGKRYLLSCDLPWVGMRTNDPDGPHVELLSGIENSVGVKIGANSDQEHIRALAARLNPEGIPGKLLFMLRLGNNVAAMDDILEGIRKYAPSALVIFDIHGSTRNINGEKIRSVEVTLDDFQDLASVSGEHGQRVKGLHIETHTNRRRQECVDRAHDKPKHKSIVDPGFNPPQTLKILEGTAHILR